MGIGGFRQNSRRAAGALLDRPRFELVPLQGALDQARVIPHGATVTVTSSPRKGLEATVALAERLAELGYRAVPHLAARQLTGDHELATIVERLDRAGILDVFVVGGDAPEPAGAYADGLALLEAMDRLGHGFDEVGIPSYPEGHHLIDDDILWKALEAKQSYATYTVTQLCFDADTICRFAATAAAHGVHLPVVVGIPGAVDVTRLLRVGLKVGVGDSLRFLRGNASAARRLLRPVGYRPDGLVRKLAARVNDGQCRIAGLHIYTFNQVGQTVGWLHRAHRKTAA
jgi:methylenetetrahydrofolate reductase (NADPH)